MNGKIGSIVIAGGGTAGWLSAAYLNRALGESVEITLVESSAIDPIGVGEATLPTLGQTMEFIGFREDQWMPEASASYKTSIQFADWSPSVRPHFWHPFLPRPEPMTRPFDKPYFIETHGFPLIHHVYSERSCPEHDDLSTFLLPTNALCYAKRAPVHVSDSHLNVRTAYHLDAGLLAGFLRRVATNRGVRHRIGHIGEVRLSPRGHIDCLKLTDGATLQGDLYLDCTGFRSLLLGGALNEPFESDAARLLCDAAVAISARSRPQSEGLNPYTTATAQRCGWTWQIPLFHRDGTGYVYSSAFLDKEGAERELRAFLGSSADGSEAKHIRIRVGQSRNLWVSNCVAIGLSGSFIEPLESSGLFLIEYGLASLLACFPDKRFAAPCLKKYNRMMRAMYEEIRDFIVLHYYVSKRNDSPFWEAAKQPSTVPDTLHEKLELFYEGLPMIDSAGLRMFRSFSYIMILDGNGERPHHRYPILSHVDRTSARLQVQQNLESCERVAAEYPDHYEHLRRMHETRQSDAMRQESGPRRAASVAE